MFGHGCATATCKTCFPFTCVSLARLPPRTGLIDEQFPVLPRMVHQRLSTRRARELGYDLQSSLPSLHSVISQDSSAAYYWYLNTHGSGSPSTVFTLLAISKHFTLFSTFLPCLKQWPRTVTLLDALQTAFSLFLLLVLSLGLGIVHDSLGTKAMLRCWLLASAHFVFGGSSSAVSPVRSPQRLLPD